MELGYWVQEIELNESDIFQEDLLFLYWQFLVCFKDAVMAICYYSNHYVSKGLI